MITAVAISAVALSGAGLLWTAIRRRHLLGELEAARAGAIEEAKRFEIIALTR